MIIYIYFISFFDVGETLSDNRQGFLEQIKTYPSLLRSKRFWAYCLSSAFVSGAFFSYLGGAPFVGNEVFGLEPRDLGIWFVAILVCAVTETIVLDVVSWAHVAFLIPLWPFIN